MSSSRAYQLHALPPPLRADLPTLDPASLAAVFMLELTIPGEYSLCHSVDSSASPSDSLPYLAHKVRTVSSVQSILMYAESSAKSSKPGTSASHGIDTQLSAVETAQSKAWNAHITTHLGDLVSYNLFASQKNWEQITHPALSASLPFLHRSLVSRLRGTAQAHLEEVNLWTSVEPPEEEQKSFAERQKKQPAKLPFGYFKETFGRQKVSQTAASSLELYANTLGSNTYFFGSRPTTLDILLASHILLLVVPEYPDALLRDLVLNSFPTLVEHARRVQETIFPSGFTDIPKVEQAAPGLSAILPNLSWSALRSTGPKPKDIEKRFNRARWLWYAGALVGTVAYVVYVLQLRIVIAGADEDVDEEGGGEELAEEGVSHEEEVADDDDEEEWTTHG